MSALEAARKRRSSLSTVADTNIHRWVNGSGDGIDDLTLDRFDDVLVMSLYAQFSSEQEKLWLDAAEEVFSPSAIYLKRRPKEARVMANTQKDSLAPDAPERGTPRPEFDALENGLTYRIRPGQGLSVGLYLDMRPMRAWMKANATGERVLNLFAYTCGFGLSALAGGAERAVNIDLSRRVLDWGEENLRLNGFEPKRTDFIAGDVFEWLARLAKRGETFSTVILDPPGFSTAGRKAFSAANQYARLIEAVAPLLGPEATVVACCNVARLPARSFEAQVEQGFEQAGCGVRRGLASGASPIDFPGEGGKRAAEALKVRVYRVER